MDAFKNFCYEKISLRESDLIDDAVDDVVEAFRVGVIKTFSVEDMSSFQRRRFFDGPVYRVFMAKSLGTILRDLGYCWTDFALLKDYLEQVDE